MNTITNRQVICEELLSYAEKDKDIVVLCSDSRGSASLAPFAEKYTEQFIEVGIAEQNLVSVAAGLAACGKKAYAASPACFLSARSYEQVKVDVAYCKTNVKLIGISGGVSYGALGATHHSLQDIAGLAAIPDMRVYLPSDRYQTRSLMKALYSDELPAYIRISRGASYDVYVENFPFKLNKASIVQHGKDVLIVACGEMVYQAKKAADLLQGQGISAGVLDMYCVKPFDGQTLLEMAQNVKLVVTVEEHSRFGGLGALTAQEICRHMPKKVINFALPDCHLIAGTAAEIFAHYGIDAQGIAGRIGEEFK